MPQVTVSNLPPCMHTRARARTHTHTQVVVSDVPTCGGVQYAHQHGIPTVTYPIPKKGDYPGLTGVWTMGPARCHCNAHRV